MSRRGWALFSLIGGLWGVPYMFMKVAVAELPTPVIVFSRLAIGAILLVPLALYQGTLRIALPYWKYIAFYAILEMVGPWFLITTSQRDLSSGLVALLVATVPIWATLFAHRTGDTTAAHKSRIFGIAIGFCGIALLVGFESFHNVGNIKALLFVLLASISYAWAVNMISRKAPGVSGIAINGLAMTIATFIYLPFALSEFPSHAPSPKAIFATIGLGILCKIGRAHV